MTKLIVMRGLPGSGKSTWAKAWVAEDPMHRARINRDSLRKMVHDGVFIAQDSNVPGTERAIQHIRDAAIRELLGRGVSVVSDDTNLPTRHVRDLRRIAMLAGAEFEVVDLTNVDLETCIKRDAERAVGHGFVGREVIEGFYKRFLHKKQYPLPVPSEEELSKATTTGAAVYAPRVGAIKVYMVDIDGTVAKMVNRGPYEEQRVDEDIPNWPVVDTVKALRRDGYGIIFCSGRSEEVRSVTEKWLDKHVTPDYIAVFMRPKGDNRKDSIVKLELFNKYIRNTYHVVAVLDDRQQVVDMWRSIGLPVFQVAPGDF